MGYLGGDPGEVDAASRPDERQRTIAILHGIEGSRRDRARAVAGCGRLCVAWAHGEPRLLPLYCRDRACPVCRATRSRQLAARIAAAVAHVVRLRGDRIFFVTLTQPKDARERPIEAIERLLNAWRKLTSRRCVLSRAVMARIVGGIRCVEITRPRRGQRRKHGGVVEETGYHAHLHAILEIDADGIDEQRKVLRALQKAWCEITGGVMAAQHYAPVTDARVAYVAKYACKPANESTWDVPTLTALYRALHGRRLHGGFGTWRSWAKWVEDPERSAASIAWYAVDDGARLSAYALVARERDLSTRELIVRAYDARGAIVDERTARELVQWLRKKSVSNSCAKGIDGAQSEHGTESNRGPPAEGDRADSQRGMF